MFRIFLKGESIIEGLKKTKGAYKLVLYNVSFDAKEQDIKNFYFNVKIPILEKITKGTFLVEFNDFDEAVKLVNFKETVSNYNHFSFSLKIYLDSQRKAD